MTTQPQVERTWPRRRMLVRSIISATLPVGWTWAATTALIPYFWIGHGPGSSTATVLGATRATWMSLHVWSTIAMALLTIAHVVLNRKGVSRSYRIISGAPSKASSLAPRPRGYAWLGAALLIFVTTLGGFAFAAVDDTHPDGEGRGRNSAATQVDDGTTPIGRGQGYGRR